MTRFARCTTFLFLALTLALPLALPVASHAIAEGAQPLVVVRFNQPRVYFDQALYGAISKAVAMKPEVVFDVVSYAPSTGNAVNDKKWQGVAGHNTKAVIAAMTNMGVPMERINVTGNAMPGLRYDETHVFVH